MTRKLFIAANWKMNPPPAGFDDRYSGFRPHAAVDVVVFPTFVDLYATLEAELETGAQCGRPEPIGPHTGDVSMAMIKAAGCSYVLCGHSDRRRDHHETDEDVRQQAETAVAAGLQPIVCVGETAEERDSGQQQEIVERQIAGMPSGIIVAYEPVWAIGNGKAASMDDAQTMHAFIRSLLPEGNSTRILYGGSMSPATAEGLLTQPDIDGGLVGTASLKPDEFKAIVEIAANVRKS